MKSCRELLDEIRKFDCEPGVYRVSVMAWDHRLGYTATAEFRSTVPNTIESIDAHGDTPEDALNKILLDLQQRFGKCPHCGHYPDGKREE